MKRIFSALILLAIAMLACKSTSLPAAEISPAPQGSTSQPSGAPTELPAAPATETVSPTVFDPARVGSLDMLSGYVVTSKQTFQEGLESDATKGHRLVEESLTLLNAPRQARLLVNYVFTNIPGRDDQEQTTTRYWTGDRVYMQSPGYWTIQLPSENDQAYLDPFAAALKAIRSAEYAGPEDYQGTPANHFIFDLSDWVGNHERYPVNLTAVEGNLYLAQDGNYPLHLDLRLTGDIFWIPATDSGEDQVVPGILEEVYDLSAINAVTSIDLPADIPTEVALDTGLPLPPGTKLTYLLVFPALSYDYTYETSLTDDDILAYYANLKSTGEVVNGWTVTNTGKDPDGVGGMIFLEKDGIPYIMNVSYNEYDKLFEFSIQIRP
jgi:hypothetical protein